MAVSRQDSERPPSEMTTESPVEPFGIRRGEDVDEDSHMRIKFDPLARKMIAEFIGTIVYTFIGALSATSGAGVTGSAFAHGLIIAVVTCSFGHISGGHFNPAVTLGVYLSGYLQLVTAIAFVGAQLLGGFVGGLLIRAVAGDNSYMMISGGATIIPETTEIYQGVICELVLTYIVVNSALMSATDTNSNVLAPLAVGLSYSLSIFAAGALTGASMNPARSLGPCISASIFADHTKLPVGKIWGKHYIYWVGPALGAALGALLYRLFLAKEEKRILL
uniref:Uncharacterized protein n=1 Tax=Plectus sambesii TaxID=2011161 RepID=A0A914XRT8_9BILA